MTKALATMFVGLASCVSSGVSTCPNSDSFCPDGTVCKDIIVWGPNGTTPTEPLCVPAADVAACNGIEDLEPCTAVLGAGQCHSGACFSPVCGNHVLDSGEACDDADAVDGNGCSRECKSDESCGNGFTDPVVLAANGEPEPNELCDDSDVAPHDGCSSVCDIETPRWRQFFVDQGPERRSRGKMVFDSNRGTVRRIRRGCFGQEQRPAHRRQPVRVRADRRRLRDLDSGRRSHSAAAATRSCDGLRPPSRSRRGVRRALHPRRLIDLPLRPLGVGTDGRGRNPKIGTPPDARAGVAMAYDPIHAVSVVYGGTSPILSFDSVGTYEWDGVEWRKGANGPAAMVDHSMAFDPVRGVIVLVGLDRGVLATWEYNAGTHEWSVKTPATIPPPRLRANLVWDAAKQRLMLFAGETLVPQPDPDPPKPVARTDIWYWDGSDWLEDKLETFPRELFGMLSASDFDRQRVITFGGELPSGLAVDPSFIWDGTAFGSDLPVNESIPTLQFVNHAGAYDAVRDRVVVVTPTETWELANETWIAAGKNIPDVRNAAMAYDARLRETVLFGGIDDTPSFVRRNATWTWDGNTWTPKTVVDPPPASSQATMAYDMENQRVVMFGGNTGVTTFSEQTWVWDGTTWTDITSSAGGPGGRSLHAMAYDPIRREIVIFGGGNGEDNQNIALDAMWIFDVRESKWRQGPTVGPLPRKNAALAWNNARRAIVLFGGTSVTGTRISDTWEWDGTGWTELDLDLVPGSRDGHVLTSTSHGVMLVGGEGEGTANGKDAWELRWESSQREDTCRDRRDIDGDEALGCDDGDCRAACLPLCVFDPVQFVDPICQDGGPTCGNGKCDPLETCQLCSMDCQCTAVCGNFVCEANETECPGDCSP